MTLTLLSANIQEVKPRLKDRLTQTASTSLSWRVARLRSGMLLAVLRVNGSILALSPTSPTGFTGPTNWLWTRLFASLGNIRRVSPGNEGC
jgi:hypothetical protein